MSTADPLSLFLPAVRIWFEQSLGTPTPVQRLGWPAIAAGEHALLLAPTGSGKTLAAFLACLDNLWRHDPLPRGVRVLYVSPLKALNNDIYRNLQVPLAGVAVAADALGTPLPRLEIGVRTGDTPAAERQRLLRRPPHILITTPESLHILLTSKAREVLRGVTHCIIDEIHALCPNKRGVFLALLLERLQALNAAGFVRIGLSATQRPLEEVARYLGGRLDDAQGQPCERPVKVIDAGLRKDLDLQVLSPVEQFGPLPEASVWPSIYRRLAALIREHRSTLIFANNRRSVERLTVQLNESLRAEAEGEEVAEVRAHHGSVALEVRQATEQALKEGRLRAVAATASLELGIDMGAVDLVCQVESPGNVARALQRVGRAGHLVGQQSKGRLIAKTLPDLLNQAVLAAEMTAGRVEPLRVPTNCLDVLAQQVVAMVALEDWNVEALYRLVRQAYPYRSLTAEAFDTVLQMVTGRYQFEGSAGEGEGVAPAQRLTSLQPRISWDRVRNRLQALPGSQRLALVHGGTIPDTGQYAVYNGAGLRIGELDEEFIYERRVGDSFLLGTSAWRIDRIEADRVLVQSVQGAPALVPFWRGEGTGRSADLGAAQGRFLRELTRRLDDADCLDWLRREHHLEDAAATNLLAFVRRQLSRAGCVPTDRTLIVEASRDPLGDWQVILLSPHGARLHLGLRLALENVLRRRLGYRPQCLHHDDGVLIRLTDSPEPVLDLFTGLTPEGLRDLVLEEMADSPLFALRFRQNAARALMMPGGAGAKRSPLWLQRLRGRDLLQVARRCPDFPLLAETFRECLHDHLDLPRLEQLVSDVQTGAVEVRTLRLESPSPFAASLLFAFTMANMYQYDGVESDPSRPPDLDPALLDQLIAHDGAGLGLDPRAVRQLDQRLRGVGRPPRSVPEMAEWLRRVGDVAEGELEGPMAAFLRELIAEGRAVEVNLPMLTAPCRWVLAEEAALYRAAFTAEDAASEEASRAAEMILQRYLQTHALVGLHDVLSRYPFESRWAERQIEEWARRGRLVVVPPAPGEPLRWSAPENFDQLRRGTLSLLRREVVAVPAPQWADFIVRWQRAHPAAHVHDADGLGAVLERLHGLALPAALWESAVLPARLPGYEPRWLDQAFATGRWTWACPRAAEPGAEEIAFYERELLGQQPAPLHDDGALEGCAAAALDALQRRGALFTGDLAAQLSLPTDVLRAALWSLLRRGLVTNDSFDVARRGEPPAEAAMPRFRSTREVGAYLRRATLRPSSSWPEGRWALPGWGHPDPESAALVQAHVLLRRYGIVARELALLDPGMPPWRVLYEVLSRLELAGEVRRGYFAEGLSGAQFALPEAVELLQGLTAPTTAGAPVLLLHSLDPANVYGAGAPLDLALLAGGERPFPRRAGNWLALQAGRPLLLVEQHGKRLTALPSAPRDALARAVALLPEALTRPARGRVRHKLTVETWNERPVTTTEGKELLEAAGFVRDYQAMTLYEVWRAI